MLNTNKLDQQDLKIIKQFIDIYENIETKYKEYCILCESIRKNILFQQYYKKMQNYKIEEIFEKLKEEQEKQIQIETDQYRKKLINEQINTIEQQINKIKKYSEIEKLYNMMYYGNLSEYFNIEEEKEETPTKEYKKTEQIEEKDIYFNKKSTITQIYIRVKYLYDKPNNETQEKIDEEVLNNIFDFYKKFRQPIKKFLELNYETITNILEEFKEDQTIEITQTKIQRTK